MNKGLIFTGIMSACAVAAAQAQKKPNVLVIVADDLGWGDVSYHGSAIKTPNIDRLVNQGIELDRYYTAPVSSPTRAGLMTGRYPSRFGIRQTVLPPWRDYGLDTGERTMADVLGENGYANRAIIGKWHLGHSRIAYYPLSRGFTHFYGHLNGAIDYFTHEREGELDWHNDWDSSYDQGYSTDLIAKETVNCIGKYSGENPFFLYVAFNAPHSPFQAPEDEIAKHITPEKFDALPKKAQNGYTYRAMVTRLDTAIGKIMDALKSNGELSNTIILFMSDNGGVDGMIDGSTCLPLRGHKFQEWDGGVRVPAAIYWENGFENGRKISQVMGYIDILPTITSIIGVKGKPARPYDGIDVSAVLKGKKKEIKRDLYLGCGTAVNAGYKLILPGKNSSMDIDGEFLADYTVDKYEAQNHLAQNRKVADKLRKYIIKRDDITPAIEELPFGEGRDGFVAPKEWKVTKP